MPSWQLLMRGLGLQSLQADAGKVAVDAAFLHFVIRQLAAGQTLDVAFYRRHNPQAAAALPEDADAAQAMAHWLAHGFPLGLVGHRPAFDAAFYLHAYPELQPLADAGGALALAAHYLQHGRLEGRAGHEDEAADAARWRVAAGRTGHALAHRTFHRALVQAYPAPLLGPRGVGFRGGLVVDDIAALQPLRHWRGPDPVDSFPSPGGGIATLPGTFMYGGPYCAHFGHAMAEMIHRILPSRALFDEGKLLFVGQAAPRPPAGIEALPPVMRAALSFLLVDPDDVTVIHDHRVVERLHVAQAGSTLSGAPAPAYLEMLAAFTPDRLAGLDDGRARPERLYVSRSRFRDGGLLLGEMYLQSLLQAEGWAVLHPQEHSLVEQMLSYRAARTLLFAEGSACHGLELFGPASIPHCLLLPRRTDTRHVFAPVLEPRAQRFDVLPAAELIGSILVGADGLPMENRGVSLIDLPRLADALRKLGVARLPRISARAYREAALQDLRAHVAEQTQEGRRLVDTALLQALEARCLRPAGRG